MTTKTDPALLRQHCTRTKRLLKVSSSMQVNGKCTQILAQARSNFNKHVKIAQ